MGQGGSLGQNKSLILGNWAQTQVGSNIFFNKVTNQQIQRYEVVINEKNQLSSYAARMQDQSGLICRLIYFHLKPSTKDDKSKKQPMKTFTSENTNNSRPKSMISNQISPLDSQLTLKNSPSANEQDNNIKIYCIYTDRMIPIREWNRDKIIDVITAFKKLTKIYGMFKVRQKCICENERKQVKVWINQNPMSNFPVEYVESEEDMIADFAAILVSKKEKIAKELLDIQYFDQAIGHFSKLTEQDQKRYFGSYASSNAVSHRHNNTPHIPKQADQKSPSYTQSPQVNNFYNVYINTDNSCTVNSSMQNSKFNIVNKGNFPYQNITQPSTNKQTVSKQSRQSQSQKYLLSLSQNYKTENQLSINRQFSVPNFMNIQGQNQYQTPGFLSMVQDCGDFSQQSLGKSKHKMEKQNPNQISINNMIKENQTKVNYTATDLYSPKTDHHSCMENTSIMLQYDKKSTDQHKNLSKTQKGNTDPNKNKYQTMTFLQRTPITNEKNPISNQNLTNNPKTSSNQPKFIASSNNQIKNRSKNNSSGDIKVKNVPTFQQAMTNLSLIQPSKKQYAQNSSLKNNDKKLTEFVNKTPTNQTYHKPQISSFYNLHKVSQFQERSVDEARYSQGYNFNFQQKNELNFHNNDSSFAGQSKIFVKSGLTFQQNKAKNNFDMTRNIVSPISTLKPPNLLTYNSANGSHLNKKSFPKYFQEKQIVKSIQKYNQKSVEPRQKSAILKNNNERQKSPKKNDKVIFGQQKFQYKPYQGKNTVSDTIVEPKQNKDFTKQNLSKVQKIPNNNEGFMKCPTETNQQRRKFPSTMQPKSNKLGHKKSFQEKEFNKINFGIEIQTQSCYAQSHNQGGTQNFLDVSEKSQDHEKILKKSNNTCYDIKNEKPKVMVNSYFSTINTNSSLLVTHKQSTQKKGFDSQIKKRKQFQSIDKSQDQKFYFQVDRIYENQSSNNDVENKSNNQTLETGIIQFDKGRQVHLEIDDSNRKQTFPSYQHQNLQNVRKNQKQFTFFNANQKPSGLIHIEEINPFEPSARKNQVNVFKKQSLRSSDEKQTLPRTTADERQKRMFKQTRTSQILDTNDLHSSDPGHKIQQIVDLIEKEKQRMMMSNDTMSMIQQKLDTKQQHPKFKKWQTAVNVYGSLISTVQQQGASIRKKDYTSKSQKNNQQEQKTQNLKDQEQQIQICPGMIRSDNLQTKKKIRKEVFMDYKDLFGDQNPFLKQETPQEKQKAKRLEIKKIREQQQRLLQNASSKDLLIQQKVQKQKQKHAQLKSDLSKLFVDEF